MLGINDVSLQPRFLFRLDSGIAVFQAPFRDKYGSNLCYGGSHLSLFPSTYLPMFNLSMVGEQITYCSPKLESIESGTSVGTICQSTPDPLDNFAIKEQVAQTKELKGNSTIFSSIGTICQSIPDPLDNLAIKEQVDQTKELKGNSTIFLSIGTNCQSLLVPPDNLTIEEQLAQTKDLKGDSTILSSIGTDCQGVLVPPDNLTIKEQVAQAKKLKGNLTVLSSIAMNFILGKFTWILVLTMLFYCLGQFVKEDWHVQNFPPRFLTLKTERICSKHFDRLEFYSSDWREIECTKDTIVADLIFSNCFTNNKVRLCDLQFVFLPEKKVASPFSRIFDYRSDCFRSEKFRFFDLQVVFFSKKRICQSL